ncbi:hypothetical protein ACFFK0_01940 [Paenibacillus chartarius]|uniref:Tetratricopeptide repeat protein n=1 Tax=Paenibacillus chartarius TaxID=747481 RepID=A0ABV6DF43_9BACL
MTNHIINSTKEIKQKIENMVNIGDFGNAMQFINSYKTVMIDDPEIYSIESIAYYQKGDIANAVLALKKGLIADHTGFDNLYNMGIILYQQNFLGAAKKFLQLSRVSKYRNEVLKLIEDTLHKIEIAIQEGQSQKQYEEQHDFIIHLLEEMEKGEEKYLPFNIDLSAIRARKLPVEIGNYVNTAHNKKEILLYLEQIEAMYNSLSDAESKSLLVKLLAYKLLGNLKIELPRNKPEFWGNRQLARECICSVETIRTNYLDWELNLS